MPDMPWHIQPFPFPATSPTPTPTPPPAPLTGDQQNAYDYLQQMLTEWGLQELAPDVLRLVQEGHGQQNIPGLLQDTEAYKRRFSGNELRRKQGLAVLAPGEYLQTERAYRRILESNGMPSGFYDSPSDFADWIGKDVAPTEVNQRVSLAVTAANRADAGTKRAFQDFYGVDTSHLAAFFLDQEKAMPLLDKQAKAAAIGAAGYNNGLNFGRDQAEALSASQLVSSQQYDSAVGQVAELARQGGRLAGIYGDQYGQDAATAEIFFGDAAAKRKREDLASKERGMFSGGGGTNKSSLSTGANSY